jgi:hypothetical protein
LSVGQALKAAGSFAVRLFSQGGDGVFHKGESSRKVLQRWLLLLFV